MMSKILITGCSRGLGKCLSDELSKDHLVVEHFRKTQNKKNEIIGDVNDIDFLNVFEEALSKYDINVFINNAAIYANKSLLNITDNEITEIINTNLISQILLTKRAVKYFKEKNKGTIININSLAGKNASANESIYCASKFGMDGFSKSIQLELIGTNIHIKDIYLGAMQTDMSKWRNNYDKLIDPKEVAILINNILNNEYTSMELTEFVIRRK